MQTYHIGISEDLYASAEEPRHPSIDLKRRLPEMALEIGVIRVPASRRVAPEAVKGFDCIILGDCGIDGAAIAAARPQLKHIARFGVGYDDISVDAAGRSGVIVTNVRSGVQHSVAVGAMTLLLACASGLVRKMDIARHSKGMWPHQIEMLGVGLTGRVLGIVGLGGIGFELARIARPFGLRVLASDPAWSSDRAAEAGITRANLPLLFEQSDFISVHCPLTPATNGLISLDLLQRMKRSAFLINTSRGAVVDERALTFMLQSRLIAGAALDVFATEPLPETSDLVGLDNVILTPHAVGMTDEAFSAYMDQVAVAVREVSQGLIPATAIETSALNLAAPPRG